MVERSAEKIGKLCQIVIDGCKGGDTDLVRFDVFDLSMSDGLLSRALNQLKSTHAISSVHVTESDDHRGKACKWWEVSFIVDDLNRFITRLEEVQKNHPKRDMPILCKQTNELVAKTIGDLISGPKLVSYLKEFGIDPGLIVYPDTKWRMIDNVLNYLSSSAREDDKRALKNVFSEFCHPLFHGGDVERALQFERTLDGWVKYDGLRMLDGYLILDPDELIGIGDHDEDNLTEAWKYVQFHPKKGVVQFVEGVITISEGGKKTDVWLMMNTLSADPDREWYEDEVLEDWALGEKADLTKNKVYQAAKTLKAKIAQVTSVKDFVIYDTKKTRINPKYL
jgi:hypothetical protein